MRKWKILAMPYIKPLKKRATVGHLEVHIRVLHDYTIHTTESIE